MSPSITRTQKEKKKNKVDSSRIVTSRITYAALMANQIKYLTPCCRAPPTPKGFRPFTETLENETFNWNSVEKDSNLELWAVRIPNSVRHLFLPHTTWTYALRLSPQLRISSWTRSVWMA